MLHVYFCVCGVKFLSVYFLDCFLYPSFIWKSKHVLPSLGSQYSLPSYSHSTLPSWGYSPKVLPHKFSHRRASENTQQGQLSACSHRKCTCWSWRLGLGEVWSSPLLAAPSIGVVQIGMKQSPCSGHCDFNHFFTDRKSLYCFQDMEPSFPLLTLRKRWFSSLLCEEDRLSA